MDWVSITATAWVTCGAAAATYTPQATTREIHIINTTAYTAYVRFDGTDAAAASGSHYISAVAGSERAFPIGAGQKMSYIQGTGAAVLEVLELG